MLKRELLNFESLNNHCSVIVPAHESPHHVSRSIKYWRSFGIVPFIVDSSSKQFDGDLNGVFYFHCPGMSFQHKIVWLLEEKVRTSYSVLCAQDDFILPSGIERCIMALQIDDSAHSCQGYAYRYDSPIVDLKFRSAYMQMWEKNVNGCSVTDRLIQVFTPYRQLLYSVSRTDSLLKSLRPSLCFSEPEKGGVMEVIMSGCLAAQGKSLSIQYPYWVRETIPHSWGKKIVPVKDWFDVFSNLQEVKCINDIIREQIIDRDVSVENIIEYYYNNLSSLRAKNKKVEQVVKKKAGVRKLANMLRTFRSAKLSKKTLDVQMLESLVEFDVIVDLLARTSQNSRSTHL